ncbi:MAG: hypothetical protein J7L54_00985 [Elusimicrobia bacterium]|nr:hypothetical protein [Elusimicrobiota bacterium]
MLIPLIFFSFSVVFVYWLGLNPLMGAAVGILLGTGTLGKKFLPPKYGKWIFHTIFISVTLLMIFKLADYVSGEIVAVAALWAIASAIFTSREFSL